MAVGEAGSSTSGRNAVRFDVTRNVLVPAHADIAVLELEGRFQAPARRSVGRPRLVLTAGDTSVEIKPLEAEVAHAGPEPETWRAAFPLPRAAAEASDTAFALAIGRSLVLELPRPEDGDAPTTRATNTQGEVEGQTWGSMVVDLSEARRELAESQTELAQAREEIERLQAEADHAAAATPEPDRPPVTWLEEVEAEAAASTNGAGPHLLEDEDDHHADEDGEAPALEPLADRRLAPPATFEHEAVYDATLKRIQVERRQRIRRRRLWGRLLAVVVFLAAAAAIYIVLTGEIGLDILELF